MDQLEVNTAMVNAVDKALKTIGMTSEQYARLSDIQDLQKAIDDLTYSAAKVGGALIKRGYKSIKYKNQPVKSFAIYNKKTGESFRKYPGDK